MKTGKRGVESVVLCTKCLFKVESVHGRDSLLDLSVFTESWKAVYRLSLGWPGLRRLRPLVPSDCGKLPV